MARLSRDNPLYTSLMKLVLAIDREIGLKPENQVLIMMLLNTEEKAHRFNQWVRTKIVDDHLETIEDRVMGAASRIGKGLEPSD